MAPSSWKDQQHGFLHAEADPAVAVQVGQGSHHTPLTDRQSGAEKNPESPEGLFSPEVYPVAKG